MTKIKRRSKPLAGVSLKKPFALSSPLRKTLIIEDRFRVENNRLHYWMAAPEGRRGEQLPHSAQIDGKWSLSENHDLTLKCRQSRSVAFTDKIMLDADIAYARKNSLGFAARRSVNRKGAERKTFELNGKWKCDRYNRLVFLVRKKDGAYDSLLFKGAWDISDSFDIVYKYGKTRLKTKERIERDLTISGAWELSDKNKLKFYVDKDKENCLEIKASLESVKIYPAKGKFRFRIGVGLKKRKRFRDLVVFGRIRKGRDYRLDFRLEKNGSDVIMSKKFGKGIEAFLRSNIKRSRKEIGAGIRMPF
jgi:hypothetical protein